MSAHFLLSNSPYGRYVMYHFHFLSFESIDINFSGHICNTV